MQESRTTLSNDLPDCPFCDIAHGRDPAADVVCEGQDWIAFFPLNPATPGHTLVIPRVHVSDLWNIEDPALAADLMAAAIHVGRAIETALQPEGINLITSAGKTAEQTVFHLHLHIVPRWRRDGFGQIWPVEGRFDDASLGDVAAAIRSVCRSV